MFYLFCKQILQSSLFLMFCEQNLQSIIDTTRFCVVIRTARSNSFLFKTDDWF